MKALETADKNIIFSLFDIVPTKAQERQLKIIEAAVEDFASVGIEKSTYESIARRSKVSRPLVHHYFPDKEVLIERAITYVRANFQSIAVKAIQGEEKSEHQLNAYIVSTFDWLKKYPAHVKVWLLFYYYCGIDAKYRKLNSDLVDMGHRRIKAILEIGHTQKRFIVKNATETAKLIQLLITGGLLAGCTENADLKALQNQVVHGCNRLIFEKMS